VITSIRSPRCMAIVRSVWSGVMVLGRLEPGVAALGSGSVMVRRASRWETSLVGPSMVRITSPDASCWATTISGCFPWSLACSWTCTTGKPSMCGTLSPASAWAPSHDIVRHMPSSSRSSSARGMSMVESSSEGAATTGGMATIADSAAARRD
jgi:hypothetical protein